jgi:hypothetical protein
MLIQKQARLLLASLLLVGCSLQASTHPPQANSSIDRFWARFRIAVINGDKEGVARMTQFPVAMPYGVPVVRTSSQLLARYKQVFDGEADAAKCFTSATPQKDPRWPKEFTVGCDNGSGQEVIVYRFVLTKMGWRFKSLDNINE